MKEFADCVSHASCKNKLDVNTNRNIREMDGGVKYMFVQTD